jgi:hypothetical protein
VGHIVRWIAWDFPPQAWVTSVCDGVSRWFPPEDTLSAMWRVVVVLCGYGNDRFDYFYLQVASASRSSSDADCKICEEPRLANTLFSLPHAECNECEAFHICLCCVILVHEVTITPSQSL